MTVDGSLPMAIGMTYYPVIGGTLVVDGCSRTLNFVPDKEMMKKEAASVGGFLHCPADSRSARAPRSAGR